MPSLVPLSFSDYVRNAIEKANTVDLFAEEFSLYKTGAYIWRNNVNGKVYVGGAYKSLEQRCKLHLRSLLKGTHPNKHFRQAWNKYGGDAFEFLVLERCRPDDVQACEQKWIDYFCATDPNRGYNRAPKAGSNIGIKFPTLAGNQHNKGNKHTEETRRHLSTVHTGKKHKMSAEGLANIAAANEKKRGKKWTEEQKAALRAVRAQKPNHFKGRKHTPESIAKMSAARKAATTDETRAKLRAANLGKKYGDDTKAKVSAAGKGRVFSAESRAKKSASLKAYHAKKKEEAAGE